MEVQFMLHKLPKQFILTSDEPMVLNDLCYQTNYERTLHNFIRLAAGNPISLDDEAKVRIANSKEGSFTKLKVIAVQLQIVFSILSEKEQKEIGGFDLKRLSNLAHLELYSDLSTADFDDGFYFGFQKAQELLSDKVFTLEDVKKAISMARMAFTEDGVIDMSFWVSHGMEPAEPLYSEEDIIQSLTSPTYWRVDLEMENNAPKFVDNKVKILRVWNNNSN